jgi:hypothetical protein
MTFQPPPYDPDVPKLPTDSLKTSQPQFENNFLQLYNNFLKNHVELDAASSAGNHTIIQLIELAANDGIQTDVGELSVYVQDVVEQADQVFLAYQGQGQKFQYTNYQLYKPEDNPGLQEKHFSFLPGKILLYFGLIQPTLKANIIDLSPYVARHIVSVSLCPLAVGTNSFFKPYVRLVTPKDGIYQGIEIINSAIGNAGVGPPPDRTPPDCYYMVMANI